MLGLGVVPSSAVPRKRLGSYPESETQGQVYEMFPAYNGW
ncbi:uncharacterized protein FFB20_10883 [Fusarium fujikuroi]|nr:uncharacterized protein FFE2_02540 [Fusarium fujikuroi]SCN89571.1 uncharacterized protein FFM5_04734 [Fusarium fujikuroi]SCN99223.1 uncharacterized protein FFB20_10883 [Fusarium fujikuroi]SCO03733.1 uncharacterized protein FFC1_09418 [Fusarium fujikuroi]SCO35675.1 uncharacterized protein FFNC_04691 [Fusarium fujikuroi]